MVIAELLDNTTNTATVEVNRTVNNSINIAMFKFTFGSITFEDRVLDNVVHYIKTNYPDLKVVYYKAFEQIFRKLQ